MKIHKFQHEKLRIDELEILPGEIWSIYGTNDSGLDYFINLCQGELKDSPSEQLELPEHFGIVSFEQQQEIFEEELRNDDSDFLGYFDPGTLVKDYITDSHKHFSLIESFGMTPCLELGYRQLSSGQSRKLLLLREITSGATTLLLQNPYDGLDQKSCHELNALLPLLAEENLSLILLLYSVNDIPDCSSHLAIIENGHLHTQGELASTKHLLPDTTPSSAPIDSLLIPAATTVHSPETETDEELVHLQNGFARYGKNLLFTGLTLRICRQDHTLITGPNGCGKSTLLDILTGDNSNCYVNNLSLLGKRRGTGESIWDIKKNIGLVSPALHRDHRVPGTALHIILSGLFDSIGLYDKVKKSDIKAASHLLTWLGLSDKSDTSFRQLPFSEQRLILIGRALIKQPKLLILDEPTHGLDDYNRSKLLTLLEYIAKEKLATIIYVSHREDEFRSFFTRQIKLDTYAP